jgi:hypothetical protein
MMPFAGAQRDKTAGMDPMNSTASKWMTLARDPLTDQQLE